MSHKTFNVALKRATSLSELFPSTTAFLHPSSPSAGLQACLRSSSELFAKSDIACHGSGIFATLVDKQSVFHFCCIGIAYSCGQLDVSFVYLSDNIILIHVVQVSINGIILSSNEVQQSPDNHTMLNHTTLLFAPHLPWIKRNVTKLL